MTCFNFNWNEIREKIIKRSFPLLDTELRWDILRHLKKVGEDSIYGIAIGIGKTIPSVMKTLQPLIGKYIVYEEKPFRQRKKATVYKLTDLGEIAVLVLNAPDIELPQPMMSYSSDLMKMWLDDECLREILVSFILESIGLMNLEENYEDLRLSKEIQLKRLVIDGSFFTLLKLISTLVLLDWLKKLHEKAVDKDEKEIYEYLTTSIENEEKQHLGFLEAREYLRKAIHQILTDKKYKDVIKRSIEYVINIYVGNFAMFFDAYTRFLIGLKGDKKLLEKWMKFRDELFNFTEEITRIPIE